MVIVPKEIKEKLEKELEKMPDEIIEKWAKLIHKHYGNDDQEYQDD